MSTESGGRLVTACRRRLWSGFALTVLAGWIVSAGTFARAAGQAAAPPGAAAQAEVTNEMPVMPDDPRVVLVGRVDDGDRKTPRFGYPGGGWVVRFRGSSLAMEVSASTEKSALTVVVDHGTPELRVLKAGANRVSIEGLRDDAHTVEVYKRTETWQGILTFRGLRLGPGAELLEAPALPRRKLMLIGDSVTCGAGVDNNAQCKADPARPANDVYRSYGMLLGRRLDAQVDLVCYGGRGLVRDYRGLGIADGVVNAPEFEGLALASDVAADRVTWDARRYVPDGIVVSLGTNDFNLQKDKPLDGDAWVKTYVALVRKLRAEYPAAAIWLTEGAITTDPLLRAYVQRTVVEVGDAGVRYAASTHYPGNGCDGHPTAEQHRAMADDFEPVLRRGLGW